MATINIPTPVNGVSKKLTVAIASLLVVLFNDVLQWGIAEQTVQDIVQIAIGYFVGQGIADFGKGKSLAESKNNKAAGNPPVPPGATP